MSTNKHTVTCSFSVDRDIYNAYKNIITTNGENVKDNLIKYMLKVIEYETSTSETISAIMDVEKLKSDSQKKTYNSFTEIFRRN